MTPMLPCRLTSVTLVCKRFAELSLCAFCRRTTICLSGERAVERGRQLLGWLPRHARRVRYLKVSVTGAEGADGATLAELDSITACCLMALGMGGSSGGRLEHLTVRPATALSTTAWLQNLRRLRRLKLGSPEHRLRLTGPLHLLARAREFELIGQPIEFGAGVWLPPSLTRLALKDKPAEGEPAEGEAPSMPHQVRLKMDCMWRGPSGVPLRQVPAEQWVTAGRHGTVKCAACAVQLWEMGCKVRGSRVHPQALLSPGHAP